MVAKNKYPISSLYHKNYKKATSRPYDGFTIVELLIVIVVIGILATITVIAYTGISQQAGAAGLKSDLKQASTQLELAKVQSSDGSYPNDDSGLKTSNTTTFEYTKTGNDYCLSATNDTQGFHITNMNQVPAEGVCVGHAAPGGDVITDGSFLQTITSVDCPSTRTRAVDARDNHTYWVQQLNDGKCWMLTNLAYAGGGINTYGDVKTLTNGTSDSEGNYTEPKYYIPTSGSNVTTEPTAPSISTSGTGQYGYFYNWCGAMGGQATAACVNDETPTPNTSISVCPSGWRLPTAGSSGDFNELNIAVNGGLYNTDAGLRNNWLAQRGGIWDTMFFSLGSYGYYWSSSEHPSSSNAYNFPFNNSNVNPIDNSGAKTQGYAVRCLAV